MLTVHGEIVGQGSKLAVLAGGSADVYEQALAAQMLGTLTPVFKKSDPPGALLTELAWPTVVQLAHLYGEAWQPGPNLATWIREQVIARTTRQPMGYAPPEPMVPYYWQSEGADLIAATGRALITDEPGTGKSGTAVLGLVERWQRLGFDGPAVIVCPASVIDSWLREWAMWAPHVRAVAWRDKAARKGDKASAPERRERLIGTAEVYVASYDMVRLDNTAINGRMGTGLAGINAASLVIDECHFIKNGTSARTRAVLRLAEQVHKVAGAIVGLSGTPITRDTGDLHPMLKALEPGSWPSKERMVGRYCRTMLSEDYGETILGLEPLRKPEFDTCLLGQHRRVKKADVLADLPPKVYTTRTVDMPERWRKVYDDFEQTMFAEMPTGEELSVMDAMSVYTHLSQLASAGGTVEITYGPDEDEEGNLKRHVHINLEGPSWKVGALMELLEERRGRQTIVCAPSRQLMELAGAEATKQGYRVGYVVGGQSASRRTADIDAFQAGKLDLICVTTKAGGVGLTLTAADAVVFLQRPWELDESIQMEDRAHRIGADHESIQIIDIIARNTIDTRRRDALRGKVRHLAEVVNDPRLVAELLGGKTVVEMNTTPPPRELISA